MSLLFDKKNLLSVLYTSSKSKHKIETFVDYVNKKWNENYYYNVIIIIRTLKKITFFAASLRQGRIFVSLEISSRSQIILLDFFALAIL